MTELEQIRAEMSVMREALLFQAHTISQMRLHFFNLPSGKALLPDHTYANQVGICAQLGAISYNTPNVEGSHWLLELEKSHGTTFGDFRKRWRAQVDKEDAERAARRKAAA